MKATQVIGEERHRVVTEARVLSAFDSKGNGKRKRPDALETTNAVRGLTSSEIRKLISNPKSHSFDLVALKVALSAKLSTEAEAR
jgi:hypothetical protein